MIPGAYSTLLRSCNCSSFDYLVKQVVPLDTIGPIIAEALIFLILGVEIT